jgi:hypothetical protein
MRSFVISVPISVTIALPALLAVFAAETVSAAGLNDTGQTLCYDAANTAVACSAAVGGDGGVNPRQDARYGRDAAAGASQLSKIGAGAAGFDFSKIANNGSSLAASAALGSAATDWACTKDNVTGLTWEIKPPAGLRASAHTYTWYSTAATNGGNVGAVGSDTCGGTLSAYGNQCNTQNYVAAVNAVGLCGASDWRLPSQRELLTIVRADATSPSVDITYFPNTISDWYWTSSTYVFRPTDAFLVFFSYGYSNADAKSTTSASVRLVRGG